MSNGVVSDNKNFKVLGKIGYRFSTRQVLTLFRGLAMMFYPSLDVDSMYFQLHLLERRGANEIGRKVGTHAHTRIG